MDHEDPESVTDTRGGPEPTEHLADLGTFMLPGRRMCGRSLAG